MTSLTIEGLLSFIDSVEAIRTGSVKEIVQNYIAGTLSPDQFNQKLAEADEEARRMLLSSANAMIRQVNPERYAQILTTMFGDVVEGITTTIKKEETNARTDSA